jgi:hypothetical protein
VPLLVASTHRFSYIFFKLWFLFTRVY